MHLEVDASSRLTRASPYAGRRDTQLWHDAGPFESSAPCCAYEPNDACNARSVAAWLQFADWYRWPHVLYYDSPAQLMAVIDGLLANATRRRELSALQKAFFRRERRRAEGHVLAGLRRALDGRTRAHGVHAEKVR